MGYCWKEKCLKLMTIQLLCQIIEENKIPKDVHIMSDSGWECGSTEMDGLFYHRKSNTIVFTQGECSDREYEKSDEWEILYVPGLIKLGELEVYPVTNAMAYGVTEIFKKEIKAAGDFESYYGVHETDKAYNKIDLRRPLFYCIKIKGKFIGYIGFNNHENILEPEIYIFEQYRHKGYGTRVLKKMIDMAFKEGLVKEWREENEGAGQSVWKKKTLFPSQIVSTVRVENIYSRQLMKACGFNENKDVITEFVVFPGEEDFGSVKVVRYYLTKDQYLEGD